MRVVTVGGGPGGLFAGILLRSRGIASEVTVYERNAADDTFGFGVVFSDETLDTLRAADGPSLDEVEKTCRHWTGIDIVSPQGRRHSTGHGFSAIARLELLRILTARARELGVEIRHRTEIDPERLPPADLVLAADGANSRIRSAHADRFRPTIELGAARYAWFGTPRIFDSFTFLFEATAGGFIQAHCYPYSDSMSTFIVETSATAWRAAGLDATDNDDLAAGETDTRALEFTEDLFAKHLDGHGLVGNNSRWLRFPTISNERWSYRNVVLLGDAVHTAHFSVGSGTKLAMEDAIALVDALEAEGTLDAALDAYETERRPVVESLQRAAHTSRTWFETADRYRDLEQAQFAFQLLTRSQRITFDNLRLRDPGLVADVTGWFRATQPEALRPDDPDTPPMFYPLRLRALRLANRVGVSPMAQYSAVDGTPNEWHLVHLGSRAVGGAGLVMTEMTCVSPQARITPGCTGLWNADQEAAWAEVTGFVHERSNAAVGLQLGHAGRKGSTKVPWEADDREDVPLEDGNWSLLAPSPIPWLAHNQIPVAMTRREMDAVRDDFVASAERGLRAGFDLLELHMAHGYLLSSFLSPLSNRRDDGYGGSLEDRARYPLEVFDAVREVWPDDRPMSVRISATDWIGGGNTGDEAVGFASMLKEHGCDIVDVSTGQVHPDQAPRYGRLYQTPYSDRIRHEAGIPTMTVGAVSSVDDVNTVIASGRADLCLLARAHLVDPYWTLNAAIDQGYRGHRWPVQYLAGRRARRREQDPATRLLEP